jgi:preprotein translocase subunit SecA
MAISVTKVLTKVFGSRNERLLKRYRKIVEEVNGLEPRIAEMTDPQLRERTAELRDGLTEGKLKSADVMAEAFAIIRESMDRHIGIRAIFDPDNKFDPDVLSDDMLERYDEVQRRMIGEGLSWQQVTVPPELYKEIRRMYPESRPPFRARCFDVQLIGGIVLYEGKIAEMATGEGKTFVAPLACFVRALEGHHCHVVTVNDYLVRRDATWLQPAFTNLGITVGYIQSTMEPGGDARRNAYQCDITYGTNAEFGFDFLRDNMKERASLQVQGPLDFVIVDEVDSILIDEARTPLIISGPAHDDAPKYRAADAVARKLIELNKPWDVANAAVEAAKRAIKAAEGDLSKSKGDKAKELEALKRKEKAEREMPELEKRKEGLTQYYEVELDRKSVHLTHEGFAAAQDAAGVGSFFVGANMEWPHLMDQAMRAHVVYEKDKDYVVERGNRTGQMEVIIVDEFTGRKMEGRQWSDGLHQAAEAKERVPIKQESQTLATITLQNYFKMYKSLSGMTGTAMTEAEEFNKIYGLDVVTIPTNRPCVRVDSEDRVYRTESEKWDAIIEEIKQSSDAGRPVLVGTTSVEKSESLSNMLKRKYGVQHEVLNAKHHEREAEIVAFAGQQHVDAHGKKVGNVTIATNMAGRGTDIKLVRDVAAAGGLHVIGTERHTARRIDNQLRGRSGRQGDPGSSRFYVSLQDDLMKMFAGEWTIKVLGWIGMEEGMAIEDKRISKAILKAQKKVEERNFSARKSLLEYDEVNDYQRSIFYGMRQRVLLGRQVEEVIWDMIGQAIVDAVDKFITHDVVAASVSEWVRANLDVIIEPDDLRGMREINDLEQYVKDKARAETETNITSTLGEFMGEDATDTKGWDTKGLQGWAMSRFKVNWSQAQIRQMTAKQVEEQLRTAAVEQVNAHDCSGLMKFLEPYYAEKELSAWAHDKFNVEIAPKDMLADERTRTPKTAAEIASLIEQQARRAYADREIKYPVEHALTFAYGGSAGSADNPYAAEYVRTWVHDKYRIDLTPEKIRTSTVQQLCDEIVQYQADFLRNGKFQKMVDDMIAVNPTDEALRLAVNERFNMRLTARDWEASLKADIEAAKEENPDVAPDPKALRRQRLMDLARQFLRKELTDLEQFVLIQILDTSWKDHLYAMDMLKAGIGLHAFAERDPRILYKKEGFAFFEQMMRVVRDKVTDLIFRARVVGQVEARSAYREQAAVHETAAGYGVHETMAQPAASEGEQASAEGGGAATATAVKPIVREAAKVGRNDPCPCGSGKKYKKCCGVNAA